MGHPVFIQHTQKVKTEGHVDYLLWSLKYFLCLLDVFKHLGFKIPQRISEPFYVCVFMLVFYVSVFMFVCLC